MVMIWGVYCNILTCCSDELTMKPDPKAVTATDGDKEIFTFEYVELGFIALTENVIAVSPSST